MGTGTSDTSNLTDIFILIGIYCNNNVFYAAWKGWTLDMITVLSTIVVFLIIIMVHEFGHFVAAKSLGVTVQEFAIGFGPTIWKKQGKETLYSVRLLPIGGFCKMEGEDEDSQSEGALNNKPVWKRLIIISAGAIVNILIGLLIFFLIFTQFEQIPTLEIAEISEGSPAQQILEPGDVIRSINGRNVYYYKDFKFILSNEAAGPVSIEVERDGQQRQFTITPQYNEADQTYFIGVTLASKTLTFLEKLKYCFYETFFVIRLVIYSFIMLITGQVPISEMSGPVGASTVIGTAAKTNWLSLFNIFAVLSINIGIFNLIPFPALDGGRILFLLIELVRRKPIPAEKEGYVHFVGLIILFGLMIFITYSDIAKLITPLFQNGG